MKQISTLLFCMLFALTASAQSTPEEVTPGVKGQLPQLPTVAPAKSGELNILSLEYVYFDFNYSGCNEAWLMFGATPRELGATSFTLQYRPHGDGSWSSKNAYISEYSQMLDYPMPYSETDFRLLVDDGVNQGLISNVVTAKIGSGPNSACNGWSESEQIFKMMGEVVGSTFQFSGSTKVDNTVTPWDENSNIFRYQWYRQNPNNGDYVAIDGATERTYVPVLDDCGYNVVLEVMGDGTNCNFTLRHNFGQVYLPVRASLCYLGNDGFVMNTDYVIPNAATSFVNHDAYNSPTLDFNPLPEGTVSERKPGQYVFRLPVENYEGYEFDLAPEGSKLTFVYMMTWEEEPTPWFREVQIMPDRYKMPMTVKAMFKGRPVPTDINVWGRNIDNEKVFVTKAYQETTNFDGVTFDNLYTIGAGYVLEAMNTPSTGTTYYPNVVNMNDATAVYPAVDEEWMPVIYTIDVQEPSGINQLQGNRQAPAAYYDLNGCRRSQPQHGLNIVRHADGTTTKMVIK